MLRIIEKIFNSVNSFFNIDQSKTHSNGCRHDWEIVKCHEYYKIRDLGEIKYLNETEWLDTAGGLWGSTILEISVDKACLKCGEVYSNTQLLKELRDEYLINKEKSEEKRRARKKLAKEMIKDSLYG